MPSKEYQEFYHQLISRALPANISLEEIRAGFEAWMADYPPSPNIRIESFSIGSIPAAWYFAPQAKKQNIVLFFHGGAYTAGSIRSHGGLLGKISEASGCAVLAIQYRLAPENPYPAALDDALTAYRWLLHSHHNPKNIALCGLSAGGGLVLSLLLRLKLEKISMPASAICLCPWVDLTKRQYADRKDILKPERLVEAAKMYAGKIGPQSPFISPLYGDLDDLPPILIQTGSVELLYEEILELGAKCKTAKLEKWPDMVHAWQLFASKIPEGQQAIDRIGEFLKNSLSLDKK